MNMNVVLDPVHPRACARDVCIPKSNYIVIDDVGWKSGYDDSKINGPYRSGIQRMHCYEDYYALYVFAERLGIRPQIAFVVGEWDRTNLLRTVAHSNSDWDRWDSSQFRIDREQEIIELFNSGKFSLAVHGLNHEFWEAPGKPFSRAEFGPIREEAVMRRHLDAFFTILRQNGICPKTEINSFVPPAFRYSKNCAALVLRDYGIRYISTPYHALTWEGLLPDRYFMDAGLIAVDRTDDWIEWNRTRPVIPEGLKAGFFGMHIANFLAPDPADNLAVAARWADYFQRYKTRCGFILAGDEAEAHRQTVFEKEVKAATDDRGVVLTGIVPAAAGSRCLVHSRSPLQARLLRDCGDFFEYVVDYHDGLRIPYRFD